MDYAVHGILQARTLEWVAFPFSRGSSQPRDWTQVSCIAGGFFTNWAMSKAKDRPNSNIRVFRVPSLPGGCPDGNVVMEVGSKGEGLYSQLMYSKGTNKQLRKKRETDERERKGEAEADREGDGGCLGKAVALLSPLLHQREPRVKPRDPVYSDKRRGQSASPGFSQNHVELLFPRVYQMRACEI